MILSGKKNIENELKNIYSFASLLFQISCFLVNPKGTLIK